MENLLSYEKTKFYEMHSIILEDDGIPNLMEKLKELRFDITHIDFDNY